MSVFRKVVADDGTETYEEVPVTEVLTDVELPLDVIKRSKAYQDVLKESKTRRTKIKALEAQIQTYITPSENEDENEEVESDESVDTSKNKRKTVEFDPDELFAQFEQKLTAKQQQELAARQQEQELVKKLIKDNGLEDSEEVAAIISDSKNPKTTAERLARTGYRFDDPGRSGDPEKKEVDTAIKGALSKLGLD